MTKSWRSFIVCNSIPSQGRPFHFTRSSRKSMLPTRAETTVLVNRTQLTLSEESIVNEVDETGKRFRYIVFRCRWLEYPSMISAWFFMLTKTTTCSFKGILQAILFVMLFLFCQIFSRFPGKQTFRSHVVINFMRILQNFYIVLSW